MILPQKWSSSIWLHDCGKVGLFSVYKYILHYPLQRVCIVTWSRRVLNLNCLKVLRSCNANGLKRLVAKSALPLLCSSDPLDLRLHLLTSTLHRPFCLFSVSLFLFRWKQTDNHCHDHTSPQFPCCLLIFLIRATSCLFKLLRWPLTIADLMSLDVYLRIMIFSTDQALSGLYTEMDTKEICLELVHQRSFLTREAHWLQKNSRFLREKVFENEG